MMRPMLHWLTLPIARFTPPTNSSICSVVTVNGGHRRIDEPSSLTATRRPSFQRPFQIGSTRPHAGCNSPRLRRLFPNSSMATRRPSTIKGLSRSATILGSSKLVDVFRLELLGGELLRGRLGRRRFRCGLRDGGGLDGSLCGRGLGGGRFLRRRKLAHRPDLG